jgi:hypothetical protein
VLRRPGMAQQRAQHSRRLAAIMVPARAVIRDRRISMFPIPPKDPAKKRPGRSTAPEAVPCGPRVLEGLPALGEGVRHALGPLERVRAQQRDVVLGDCPRPGAAAFGR